MVRIRNAANADLVTYSLLTRCRLRSARRPSATSGGTVAKSPESSTRSETLRAIWVPLPCAIASRALFSAGTSLTPSPTIATYLPASRAPGRSPACPRARSARRPSRPGRICSPRLRIVGDRRRLRARRRPGCRRRARSRRRSRGASPDSTLISTILLAQERDRVADVWAQLLGEHDQAKRLAGRLAAARRGRPARGSARSREREHASSLRLALLGDRLRSPTGRRSGRAEIKGAGSAAGPRSSGAGWRRESRRAPAGRSAGYASAIACSVMLRAEALAASVASARCTPRSSRLVRRQHLDDAQRGLGQGSGLVDADRVDRRQRLDRVQLLRQHAPARHAHRRRRVGEADEHHQPLRDQRHDPGRGGRHRRVNGHMAVVERIAEHRAEPDHQPTSAYSSRLTARSSGERG